jgi:hypothetical protein
VVVAAACQPEEIASELFDQREQVDDASVAFVVTALPVRYDNQEFRKHRI